MSSSRLLISTSTFPLTRDDGSPRFVWDLAEALSKYLQVTALAPGAAEAPPREVWGRVEISRFSYFWPSRLQRLAYGAGMRENMRGSAIAKLQILPFLMSQALEVRKMTSQNGAQLVNSHWMVPQGLTAAWARGRRRRFTHLLHVHAADVYLLEQLPYGGHVARYVLNRTDAVFADGSHVRDALDALLDRPSGAILQPNGVHTDRFRPKGLSPRPADDGLPDDFLVFVGRFVEKKGVAYLLQAFARVRSRIPGLGLVLIGYGPLETVLRTEVTRLNLDEAVHFVGQKTHEEIIRYLHASRAAVVPSIIDRHGETEGMPTVVIEAMAAGCRVVASAVDGIPDVVRHEENGWLSREKDPEDLAERLIAALDFPEGKLVEQAALETAQLYDWEEVARHYLDCFQSVARFTTTADLET